jgi:hypothetical protein
LLSRILPPDSVVYSLLRGQPHADPRYLEQGWFKSIIVARQHAARWKFPLHQRPLIHHRGEAQQIAAPMMIAQMMLRISTESHDKESLASIPHVTLVSICVVLMSMPTKPYLSQEETRSPRSPRSPRQIRRDVSRRNNIMHWRRVFI